MPGGCTKGRHSLSSPWVCSRWLSPIFVISTRNLKDFVILQAPCQASLSWQHAERPGRTAAGWDDELLVPQFFLSRCSLTLC